MQVIKGRQTKPQKVVVYGPEGIGKSTFASKFPKPIFIDTEGSTARLDIDRLQAPSSWTMLLSQVAWVKANSAEYQTLVIDTADWAEKLNFANVCATKGLSGMEDLTYGKAYTYAQEDWGRFLNELEDLIVRGLNVVLLAHASMRKFEQPDEMGSYDRWELKLNKKISSMTKEWADMVLFANYKTLVITDEKTKSKKATGGKRVMHTTHHPAWDAKNREGLMEEVPFSYDVIREIIERQIVEKEDPKPSEEKKEPEPIIPAAKAERFGERSYFKHSIEDWCTVFDQGDEIPGPEDKAFSKLKPITEGEFNEWIETEKKKAMRTSKAEETKEPEIVPFDQALIDNKALNDLMMENGVTVPEIQQVVALRGYYPANTPIENYDKQFIDGVLVGAWPQVFSMIQSEVRK